jgi:hypothetical protein
LKICSVYMILFVFVYTFIFQIYVTSVFLSLPPSLNIMNSCWILDVKREIVGKGDRGARKIKVQCIHWWNIWWNAIWIMNVYLTSFVFFFLFNTGVWTQGLKLDRQALYHLSHSTIMNIHLNNEGQ